MKLKLTYILLLGLTAAMLSGQTYFNRIDAWGENPITLRYNPCGITLGDLNLQE